MLKKHLPLLALLLSLLAADAGAQAYSTGLGLRVAPSYGLTVKHFFKEKMAVEGILTSRWQSLHITGLVEVQAPIPKVEGLSWFFGGGGHIGSWRGHNRHPVFQDKNERYTAAGLDGILGVEYLIQQIPFTIGVDWKPSVDFWQWRSRWLDEVGVSFRYTFGR